MRIYATTEAGERALVAIQCDTCGARIKPGPHVVGSGWWQWGTRDELGRIVETHGCPDCHPFGDAEAGR